MNHDSYNHIFKKPTIFSQTCFFPKHTKKSSQTGYFSILFDIFFPQKKLLESSPGPHWHCENTLETRFEPTKRGWATQIHVACEWNINPSRSETWLCQRVRHDWHRHVSPTAPVGRVACALLVFFALYAWWKWPGTDQFDCRAATFGRASQSALEHNWRKIGPELTQRYFLSDNSRRLTSQNCKTQ